MLLRVLILEDRPAGAERLVEALREAGYDPRWRRIDSAVELHRHLDCSTNVILTRPSLRRMDPLVTLRDLRAQGVEVPVVVIGERADKALVSQLLTHGADAYLPLDRLELLGHTIDRAIVAHRLRQEQRRSEVALMDLGTRYEALLAQRVEAQQALEHQSLYDPLSDLPNRVLLRDRMQQTLLTCQRDGRPFGLLLIDLDRFKDVNSALGHRLGDLLLRQVGQRLRGALRASDTVARLSADEFAALLPGADLSGATLAAVKLLDAIQQPMLLEGHNVELSAGIGIALFPEHGEDADSLLRHADVAMETAKRDGDGYMLYSAAQDREDIPGRLTLVGELRRAIEQRELVLYYQPKIDVRRGRISGVEALVRWRHPERGLVPPDQFIPLAEQTGLIKSLSRWVLDEALRQCHIWDEAGLTLAVNVNLSMWNLHDPRLPEIVAELLAAWQVPAERLWLEITESAVMANPARAMQVLERLRALGVRIAIDDFGTGYSSLGHLKRLPVDELKVDKSFVMDMAADSSDAAIVRSTIDLAHNLGLEVVAEGVEDRTTMDLLTSLHCDGAQGYYLSRPLPAEDLTRWLDDSPWGMERQQAG